MVGFFLTSYFALWHNKVDWLFFYDSRRRRLSLEIKAQCKTGSIYRISEAIQLSGDKIQYASFQVAYGEDPGPSHMHVSCLLVDLLSKF